MRRSTFACIVLALGACWVLIIRDFMAAAPTPPPEATPRPTPAPRPIGAAVRRVAVDGAWQAPGDLGGACRSQALVANPYPAERPCRMRRFHASSQSREDLALISRYFCKKRNGTYVEIGAVDGMKYSNTLMLERDFGWTGLLVEGQPASARKLRENRGRRNAVVEEAACAEAGVVEFLGAGNRLTGGVSAYLRKPKEKFAKEGGVWYHHVPCRPFGAMLRGAGFGPSTVIDLISVDVEGAEHVVVETMDFSIPVRVWMVEAVDRAQRTGEAAHPSDLENIRRVREALLAQGYRESAFNISTFCGAVPGIGLAMPVKSECTMNMLFEHPTLVADLDEEPSDGALEEAYDTGCCGCAPLAAAIEERRDQLRPPPPDERDPGGGVRMTRGGIHSSH